MSWIPKEWIQAQGGGSGSITAQAIQSALGYQPAPAPHTHPFSDVPGLQSALDGKALSTHGHGIDDVTGLQAALDGKQVAGSYAPASHTHDYAASNHNHTGVYQPVGSYAAASHSHAGVYEPVITAGTATQYYAGDKTWKEMPSSTGGGQPLPTLYRLSVAHANSTVTPTTIGNAGGNAAWTHTLVAGKTYRFTVFASYQTAALTTGGRMNLLGASGLAGTVQGMMWGAIQQAAAASTLEVPIYSFANGAGSFLLTTAVNPINAPHIWGADFVFHCTAGGTLSLQWASEVAASAAQLNIGSVLMVEQLN